MKMQTMMFRMIAPALLLALPALVSAVTTAPPLDGVALYASNCAGCHSPLASSAKRKRSSAQIQAAIKANRGGMGSLSSLTAAQISAVATALNF